MLSALLLPSCSRLGRYTRSSLAPLSLGRAIAPPLLADSLGGSAHTLMIATVSPLAAYLDETVRTLHYACSAGASHSRPAVESARLGDPKRVVCIS